MGRRERGTPLSLPGRQPTGEPGFDDFVSRLALRLGGGKMPGSVHLGHVRTLAERAGADPEHTVDVVRNAVQRLGDAWRSTVRAEALNRFEALAVKFGRRLIALPVAAP